jgi:hypothetical protein
MSHISYEHYAESLSARELETEIGYAERGSANTLMLAALLGERERRAAETSDCSTLHLQPSD